MAGLRKVRWPIDEHMQAWEQEYLFADMCHFLNLAYILQTLRSLIVCSSLQYTLGRNVSNSWHHFALASLSPYLLLSTRRAHHGIFV